MLLGAVYLEYYLLPQDVNNPGRIYDFVWFLEGYGDILTFVIFRGVLVRFLTGIGRCRLDIAILVRLL